MATLVLMGVTVFSYLRYMSSNSVLLLHRDMKLR